MKNGELKWQTPEKKEKDMEHKFKKEDFRTSYYRLKDTELVLICEALEFADKHNFFKGADNFNADDLKCDLATTKAASIEMGIWSPDD